MIPHTKSFLLKFCLYKSTGCVPLLVIEALYNTKLLADKIQLKMTDIINVNTFWW